MLNLDITHTAEDITSVVATIIIYTQTLAVFVILGVFDLISDHILLLLQQQIQFVFDFILPDIWKNTVSYVTELWAASSHLQKYDEGVDMSYIRQPSTSIGLCRPEQHTETLTGADLASSYIQQLKTATRHADDLHAVKDDLVSTSSCSGLTGAADPHPATSAW